MKSQGEPTMSASCTYKDAKPCYYIYKLAAGKGADWTGLRFICDDYDNTSSKA
jgi:hypothetical protein